jgi:putative membrane protein insertion efficiency factor
MIRAYQLVLRPVIPPSCRFAPSCSEYARAAFLQYGVLRGGWLAVRRTARCNGWHPGGYDPVPGSGG